MNVGRYSKTDAALFLWEEVMTLSTIPSPPVRHPQRTLRLDGGEGAFAL